MASIEFEHASVAVGSTQILHDISCTIHEGEFVGVIGPSGSGKSTLLRAIAGFASVVRGVLRFDGVDVAKRSVADRDIGMVFQDPVLFAHRSVERNVSFPLEIQRQEAAEIRKRVQAEVRALHFEHLLERRPDQLSRGESQLVQIARSMVRTPGVLLLDEPLASLDEGLKMRMRNELKTLQAGYQVTTVMTTNDPADAWQMPSRLIVLHAGRLVQHGTTTEVRAAPATVDAAMATGECWMLPVVVTADAGGFWLTSTPRDPGDLGQSHATPVLRHRAWSPLLAPFVGTTVQLGLRPDDVSRAPGGHLARVKRVVPGQSTNVLCEIAGRVVGLSTHERASVGDVIELRIDHAVVFETESGAAIC